LVTNYLSDVDTSYGALFTLDEEMSCNWCMNVILDTPTTTLVAHTLMDVVAEGIPGLVFQRDWEVPVAAGVGPYGTVDWLMDLLLSWEGAVVRYAYFDQLSKVIPAELRGGLGINAAVHHCHHIAMVGYMHFKHEVYAAMEELGTTRYLACFPEERRAALWLLLRAKHRYHRAH
jgi:hypothetical protein